jgi:putative transposase
LPSWSGKPSVKNNETGKMASTRGTSKLHLGPLPVFPFLEPGERDSVPSSSNPGKALYTLDELATAMYQGGCSKRGITRTLETFGGKVFSRLGFPDHGSCGGEKRDGENDQFEGSTPSSSSWGVSQGPKGYRSFRSGNAFLGIDDGGYREVLGFWTSGSDAESSLSWKEILFSLKERGLTEPLLVVGDGLQDLREAVKEVYPEAQFQSDLVHKTRNVLRKVRKRDERAVLEDVKKMYAASSLEEFQEHFEKPSRRTGNISTRKSFPGRGICPISPLTLGTLPFCSSTSAPELSERCIKEIKRRSKVVEVF